MEITEKQYNYAISRIEALLPLVDDSTPADDKNALELVLFSEIAADYEEKYYPIPKPTVGELIRLQLEEKGMSQKQLAKEIGVSPSRISEYISGKSEPSLKIAGMICALLGITPAAMLGM